MSTREAGDIEQRTEADPVVEIPRPICGVISLVAPLLGLGVGYLLGLSVSSGGGSYAAMGAAIVMGLVFLVGAVLGFVFSIIAFVRKERWLALRIIALLLNVTPLLLALAAIIASP